MDGNIYAALLKQTKASMVFIDRLYNVPIASNVSGLGAVRHRDFALTSADISEEQFERFSQRCVSTPYRPQHARLHPLRMHGLASCPRAARIRKEIYDEL